MTRGNRSDPSGRRRRSSVFRSVALSMVALVALAGCASIPSTGRVQTGDPITNKIESDIEYLPSGPVAGSDQERILRGFIEAGTGSQGDYEVAREYMTEAAAKKWNPQTGVLVRQGSGAFTSAGQDAGTYTIQVTARVDASGHYSESQPTTAQQLDFAFEKVSGEWRISSAPAGIVLSTANFDLVFRPHALYFFDPTHTYLVPDERWFLARSSPTTRIAEALLAGPSPWLSGAVSSAFPAGTRLDDSVVPVSSGTAKVDLTSAASDASATDLARMRAQLVASFSTISTVSAVDISVQGSPVSIPNDTGAEAITDPPVDARPLVISDGKFGFASTATVSPISGLSKTVVGLNPTSVELSTKQTLAAVGTASGVYVARNDGSSRRLDDRSSLTDPSLDDLGFIWSAQERAPQSLTAYAADGTAHPIESALPSDEQLTAFKISRDGTRIALLLDADGTTHLYVAAIVRDDDLVPVSLGVPIQLTPPAGTPVSVTWVDELTVGTLSTSDDGDSLVSEHDVGGETTDLGSPNDVAVGLVGGNGADRIRVLTVGGNLLEPRGSGWEDTGIAADLLATQR